MRAWTWTRRQSRRSRKRSSNRKGWSDRRDGRAGVLPPRCSALLKVVRMSKSGTRLVAVAQIESKLGDLDANLRKHLDVIDAARATGVEVLVFPEMSLTGHSAGAETLRLAIGREHPFVADIAHASDEMCTV